MKKFKLTAEELKVRDAAPQLLEALKQMTDIFYIIGGTDEVAQEEAMIKAKEAINKALN